MINMWSPPNTAIQNTRTHVRSSAPSNGAPPIPPALSPPNMSPPNLSPPNLSPPNIFPTTLPTPTLPPPNTNQLPNTNLPFQNAPHFNTHTTPPFPPPSSHSINSKQIPPMNYTQPNYVNSPQQMNAFMQYQRPPFSQNNSYGMNAMMYPPYQHTQRYVGRSGGNSFNTNKYEQGNDVDALTYVEPPADEELVSTIHRVAVYCANNMEMKEYVRQNNGHEHKFRFIVGGEGADYFEFALQCYKNGVDPTTQLQKMTNKTEIGGKESVADSTKNKEADLAALCKHYEEPNGTPELNEALQNELEEVLSTLQHQATSDSIRSARHWVEVNCSTVDSSKEVASAITKKMLQLESFTQRLHLLYVVHDVLQSEAVSDPPSTALLDVFKPHLPALLRLAHQLSTAENSQKVKQILQLWKERGIVNEEEHSCIGGLVDTPTGNYQTEQPTSDVQKTKRKSRFDQAPGGVVAKVAPPTRADPPIANVFPHSPPTAPQAIQQKNPMAPNIYGNIPIRMPMPPASQIHPSPYVMNGMVPMPQSNMMAVNRYGYPMASSHPQMVPPMFVQNSPGIPIFPPPPPPDVTQSTEAAGGFDKKPEACGMTPETVPVGMMATMLKTLSKRGKNMQTAFVPYKPLDALITPQLLPTIEPPSDYVFDRLDCFYEEFDDIKDAFDKGDKSNGSVRTSRSAHDHRGSSRSPSRERGGRRDSHSGDSSSDDESHRHRRRRRRRRRLEAERPSAWAQKEIGVAEDGSVLDGASGSRGERLGLGLLAEERHAKRDAFEQFRRQRANKYHEHIAHNQASRREPEGLKKLPETEKLCYICQQPGHLAKDCKYGLS